MTCSECNGTGYRESYDGEVRECCSCDGTGGVCWACMETGDDCDCKDDSERE